jgi:hypothetical protein
MSESKIRFQTAQYKLVRLGSFLVFSSSRNVDLPNGLLRSAFATNILHVFLIYPTQLLLVPAISESTDLNRKRFFLRDTDYRNDVSLLKWSSGHELPPPLFSARRSSSNICDCFPLVHTPV